MKSLAEKYPRTKFTKSISAKCIPNFPDKKVPTILMYKGGKLLFNIVNADEEIKMTLENFELFLAGFEMIDYKG